MKILKTKYTYLFLILLSFVLNACSGGGEKTSLPADTNKQETSTISGIASKGPIKGAFVNVYLIDKNGNKSSTPMNNTPALTDENGNYSIAIPKTEDPVVVEVTGSNNASYISEVTGKPVAFQQAEKLRAIVSSSQTYSVISVTPLTNAAFDRVIYAKQNNPATDIVSTIAEANAYVAKQNNLVDIIAKPDKNYNAALTLLQQVIESTPGGNTTTLATKLQSAVTTVTGLEAYKSEIQTAATSLPASVSSSIASEVNNIKTAVDSSISPVSVTLPPIINYTPPAVVTNPTTPSVQTPSIPNATVDTTPPTAPKNLKGVASSSGTSISLSWDISLPGGSSLTTVSGYDVYQGNSSSVADAVKITTVSNNSFVDSKVLADSTYYYWVKAVNANNIYSDFSLFTIVKTTTNPVLPVSFSISTSGLINQ